VRRLALVRIRVCTRCGRGGAEFKAEDGGKLVVRLEPARAVELRGEPKSDEMRWMTDVVLAQLEATGQGVREVVLDQVDGIMRAFLTLAKAGDASGEPEVVACTPEEGVAIALRGGFRLFATDEALTAPRGRSEPRDEGGAGGGTLH
jgi:hypothetical protein